MPDGKLWTQRDRLWRNSATFSLFPTAKGGSMGQITLMEDLWP
jgi:hypothetical protein